MQTRTIDSNLNSPKALHTMCPFDLSDCISLVGQANGLLSVKQTGSYKCAQLLALNLFAGVAPSSIIRIRFGGRYKC